VNTFLRINNGEQFIDSELLLGAYCQGIFPMANGEEGEIHWFSPEQRGIIPLDGLKISRSLRQELKKKKFQVRFNSDFDSVIKFCSQRKDVWISRTIQLSYKKLYELGFAHSVETWNDDKLVGGLYGVSIGGAFFGESMFSLQTNASKVALVALVERLKEKKFELLDTQYNNQHLSTLGCIEISREEYLRRLQFAISLKRSFI
jgi:leucyl/phenylalanyl-tRNA--protein transferase